MKILPSSLAAALLCLNYGIAHAEDQTELEEIATTPLEHASADAAEGIEIEGDKLQIRLDRKMKAIGNAELHQDGKNIYGDIIEYDMQNDEMHVIGNAKIEAQGSTVTGPELRMRLSESTGEMTKASLQLSPGLIKIPQIDLGNKKDSSNYSSEESAQFNTAQQSSSQSTIAEGQYNPQSNRRVGGSRGDADTIFFEGENKKRLKGARFTTCEVGRDDWYIKASELELNDHSKNVTAWNARVEFQGVPFLYTPWISFSYLNQRKTGLLAPTWGTTSRSGFELLTPFYWNIAPDMDATIATRYLGNRGMQYQGEFRYLGETYSGIDTIQYLPTDSATGETRFYGKLKHDQNFGNGWSAGYNIERVSDDKYFSELSTHIAITSRVNLPQQGYVNYSRGPWNFNALVQKYQTLNGTNLYERLPQLTLTGAKDYGPFSTNLATQWVSFDRDPTNPLISAQPGGELLTTSVTGKRFTAYPSITMPMAQPYGYMTPKLGLHYTSYSLENPEYTLGNTTGEFKSDNRALPIFSVDSGLFFDRDVRVVKNSYTQTLEPRLFYLYIPYRDQSQLPVFDTAQADINLGTLFMENQYVGNDRVNDANQISLAFTTRMIDNRTGVQRLAATVGQRFYFSDQRVGLPGEPLRTGNTSDIVTAVTARLINNWNVDAGWMYNTDTSTTTRGNIGMRYNPAPGKTLNLSYRFREDLLEQINISSQWPLGGGWYGLGRWNYSLQENQPIEGLAGVEYDAGCWQARGVVQRVSTATAEANYAMFFQLELGGLASIGSNPMRLLNRGIPGYTSTGMIPDTIQQQQSSYE